eukprot:GHVL01032812.1.p1 GENE.GHVL01032812.1~~GHVL01032812.1.p1  ORF type:complete len:362 (+),score=50.63 GHVL01032812.1:115-1200(+)
MLAMSWMNLSCILLGSFFIIKASSSRLTAPGAKAIEHITDQCFEVPHSLCIDSGESTNLITLDNIEPHFVAWYTFDDEYTLDKTGNHNHMHPAIRSGPGISGASAFFETTTADVHINDSASLRSTSMTISFWIYLLQDSTGRYRNIIRKGKAIEELTPTVMLDMSKRNILFHVSTSVHWEEGPTSKSQIPLRRWTHVAAVGSEETLKIYINGILDVSYSLQGIVVTNYSNYHVGRDANREGFEGFLDDLRIYDTALSQDKIQSMLVPGITGIVDYDFASLGCLNCSWSDIQEKCSFDKHVCSLDELNSGGYHIARVNGWLSSHKKVWYRVDEAEENSEEAVFEKRLGLCCTEAGFGESNIF